jgi:hypothetical protein
MGVGTSVYCVHVYTCTRWGDMSLYFCTFVCVQCNQSTGMNTHRYSACFCVSPTDTVRVSVFLPQVQCVFLCFSHRYSACFCVSPTDTVRVSVFLCEKERHTVGYVCIPVLWLRPDRDLYGKMDYHPCTVPTQELRRPTSLLHARKLCPAAMCAYVCMYVCMRKDASICFAMCTCVRVCMLVDQSTTRPNTVPCNNVCVYVCLCKDASVCFALCTCVRVCMLVDQSTHTPEHCAVCVHVCMCITQLRPFRGYLQPTAHSYVFSAWIRTHTHTHT